VATQRPIEPTRKPHAREHRLNRLVLLPCTSCGSDRTAVVSRTPYFVYVRCSECADVWSLAMPGRETRWGM
jgi:hypothetical protein